MPGLKGFSATSMREMRTFCEGWAALSANSSVPTDKITKINTSGNLSVGTDEITKINTLTNSFATTNEFEEIAPVQFSLSADFPISAFMSLGFTHHYTIVRKVKNLEQRKFYIQFAADTKVKVDDLEKLIDEDLYSHRGELPNNFKKTIPDSLLAFRTISMFKDEYLLDFINTEELFVRDKDRDERMIEQKIINNVKNFIMTFGKDFTFVGNQYHLEKFGVEEFPDLLFFNRELSSLVCVELKDGPFRTSYLGQLAGYLRILDDEVRKPNENPSIGILLCKSANKKFVEYVIQDYDKPMGVATYKTAAEMDDHLKNVLPPVEELKKLL